MSCSNCVCCYTGDVCPHRRACIQRTDETVKKAHLSRGLHCAHPAIKNTPHLKIETHFLTRSTRPSMHCFSRNKNLAERGSLYKCLKMALKRFLYEAHGQGMTRVCPPLEKHEMLSWRVLNRKLLASDTFLVYSVCVKRAPV